MSRVDSIAQAGPVLRRRTGIVIPVFLPAGPDRETGAFLLQDTALACVDQVEDPASICLSVDGERSGGDIAAELGARLGVQVSTAAENRGKLAALRRGADILLRRPGLSYLAVLDCDGDHFPNELLNFVRCAEHTRRGTAETDILVLGRRISKHRPLGFLRGELEELADRILLDALAFRAALDGRPLRLEGATSFEEFPDFHSGYKLFSVETAHRVFIDEPQLCGAGEDAYYRHGCEAVMVVEALVRGGYLAVVNRTTMNEQPVSTFGKLDRARLVADKIIWPCKRLGVPGPFVDQWLRNHTPRLLLTTMVPEGKKELREVRRLVLEAFDIDANAAEPRRPPFV